MYPAPRVRGPHTRCRPRARAMEPVSLPLSVTCVMASGTPSMQVLQEALAGIEAQEVVVPHPGEKLARPDKAHRKTSAAGKHEEVADLPVDPPVA